MFLEIFSKKRLVGEIHVNGYLLDTFRKVPQLYTQLKRHVTVYPFIGCAPADTLHRFRQILRSDAELLGIPPDTPFTLEILFYQMQETGEYDIGTRMPATVYSAAHGISHCSSHRTWQA